MATYFHHHYHHNYHGNNSSDVIPPPAPPPDGLQTLILMNPNFAGYAEAQAPPASSSSPSNLLFHAPTLYHAQPPTLAPQLVGVPLHSTASQGPGAYPYTAWIQHNPVESERESPRAQQGLSLTLSSQTHAVSGRNEPELHPSPAAEQAVPVGSDSPAMVSVAGTGDVQGGVLMTSKYLKAAQELLEEVVNVSVNRVKGDSGKKRKGKGESPASVGETEKEERPAELTAAEKQEVQMKKAKLITLLDEVEQRHRQYHQQMQIVVSSFEQVAGAGSARTYTSLALKTISNQFRSLREAILGQIRAANKNLGDGGGGEGEGGSGFRLFDQQIRQQRALQQLGMIQNNAWRPHRGLPEKAVSVLRAWLFEHFLHPYPKDSDKIMLAKQTGLTRSQVSNWFINARVRLWKPMIEEMYAEEVNKHEENGSEGKQSKQDQQEEPGSRSVTEEKGNVGDNQAKSSENHNSSTLISGSTASENPSGFTLIGSYKMETETQGSLKKQRNNEMLNFPDSELFNGNKQEVPSKFDPEKQENFSIMSNTATGFIGALGSYPIGEIGRFGAGHFPPSFSGNGVSLTLGLPHCESLSLQGANQAFFPNHQDIDQFRGRLDIGELNGSHSRSSYAAQLLPDFVA